MIRMHGLEKIANVAAGGPPLDNALSQEGSTPRVNTLPASAAKPGPGTESLVEDSTAESFIRKLREVLEHKSQPINGLVPVSPAGWSSSQRSPGTNSDSSRRTHVEMRFDTLRTFNLRYEVLLHFADVIARIQLELPTPTVRLCRATCHHSRARVWRLPHLSSEEILEAAACDVQGLSDSFERSELALQTFSRAGAR